MQEEEAAMEKFRSTAGASNPFAAAPAPAAEETPNILDLFGVAAPAGGSAAPAAAPAPASAASDDLLQLSGNPFANMLNCKFELEVKKVIIEFLFQRELHLLQPHPQCFQHPQLRVNLV